MIEINLLPEEFRRAEGTPPARLLTIFASVILFCCIGALIGSFYMVKIPNMRQAIQADNDDIKNLTKQKAEVDKVKADLATLDQKVNALSNLKKSRLRYGRLLDRMADAMPDGCWIRSLVLTPDAVSPTGGKRMIMALSGYAVAPTEEDRKRKITELIASLREKFDVLPDSQRPMAGQPLPPDAGWCKYLNLRFDPPRLLSMNATELPAPADVDAKVLATLSLPKQGVDFQITMAFEMPATN